jgi:hypothetical protein
VFGGEGAGCQAGSASTSATTIQFVFEALQPHAEELGIEGKR